MDIEQEAIMRLRKAVRMSEKIYKASLVVCVSRHCEDV